MKLYWQMQNRWQSCNSPSKIFVNCYKYKIRSHLLHMQR